MSSIKPVRGNIYAVTSGDYTGKNLVYINKTNDSYNFLDLPDNKPMSLTVDQFKTGISHQILDLIETLPEDITQECIQQYEKNINNR